MNSTQNAAILSLLITVTAYFSNISEDFWKSMQPVRQVTGVVAGIKPYYGHKEQGYLVYISGNQKPVNFSNKWKTSIKPGNTIDAIVRDPMFGSEMEGISVKAYK
ncbi:hypothetical protein HYU11_05110 [Candidatus Woesearchaeota archaeon]|nr:hypothetical protein [Candidatus Woesearchaeota archaeon]